MRMLRFTVILFLMILCLAHQSSGQSDKSSIKKTIKEYLDKHKEEWKLTDEDVNGWTISSMHTNKKNGITYVYINQQVNGINIFNCISSISIKGEVVNSFAKRIIVNASSLANASYPSITASEAIQKTAEHLNLKMEEEPKLLSANKRLNRYYYSTCGISRDKIRVDLVYQRKENKLRLAWYVNIQLIDKSHWWNVRIDAVTGEFLDKNDWTTHCDFGIPSPGPLPTGVKNATTNSNASASSIAAYRVFALPLESPGFGSSSLVPDPSDPVASPFGWHDTDGNPGAEYTITRGNNVYAYDDIADINSPGTSPSGGNPLLFDFPINFTQQPATYLNASLTNLFYVNNMMHDLLFHNGFDEASGNFQEKNYSNFGLDQDHVIAEGQDGGGSNNANFSTPDDGQNPTMQMYLWTVSAPMLTINSPGSIAGNYSSVQAGFGPAITVPVTGNLIVVNDGISDTADACETLINSAALSGKIAVINRGTCDFVDKVLAVQNAGAKAAIVINNVAGSPFSMGDNGNGGAVTIPSLMVSLSDGNAFKNTLISSVVNGTLNPPPSSVNVDGSLDNGIVIHEFGHGVSNRLTGGPLNSNCLSNGEQGGEGWSDFFAMMFSIRPGDVGTTGRGMGTYALNQPNNGGGIRRFQYSTDMNINPQTYGDLALSAEVHDVGEVWCTALWELNWALIDQFGFDPDWIHGTAGNNITLKLVMEGMKLQPCNPGFLDARDAILAADDNLYNGIHKCKIWEAFAKRGMGFNAVQGDPNTAGDETEGFNLPSACLAPTSPPIADFNADPINSCYFKVSFHDQSSNIPQSWHWDFGDGDTSSLQNPIHIYPASGTYNVSLLVTNILGQDSLVRNSYINITAPPAPAIAGDTLVCSGQSTSLTALVQSGNEALWFDANDSLLFEGNIYNTPIINSNTTFHVKQFVPTLVQHVGPPDNTFGGGGYHNSSFEGREKFTVFAPIRLKSVWVDAAVSGNREIHLCDSTGSVIQSLTVNIPIGQNRIPLNLDIQTPGKYQIGVGAGSNLYRNNSGAVYPYLINGLVSITASNSTTNPSTFYYYLYDWEIQEIPCISASAQANVFIGSNAESNFSYSAIGLTVHFQNTSTGSPVSIIWNFGNGNTSTAQSPSFIFPTAGTYPVTLTVLDADSCQDDTTVFITVTSVGIAELKNNFVTVIYLNQELQIDFQSPAEASITVYDEMGKLIFTQSLKNTLSFHKKLTSIASEIIFVNVSYSGNNISRMFSDLRMTED